MLTAYVISIRNLAIWQKDYKEVCVAGLGEYIQRTDKRPIKGYFWSIPG